MTEAVIISGVRTAIGNYGGTLKDVPVVRLGSLVVKETMKKAGLRPAQAGEIIRLEKDCYDWDRSLPQVVIDEVIMGHVLQAGQGQNTARQAAVCAGIPKEVSAYTVNKLCASGMKAVALAAQAIRLGEAEAIIAGGMESMSSVPYYVPSARWGARMFNAELVDGLIRDGLWEMFYNYHMGVTAENIARKHGITRREQDELTLLSHQKALAAIRDGVFKAEIVPVTLQDKNGVKMFDTDEHPRQTSLEALARLPPVFKDDGSITAGNSSGITDGAAALLVMSAAKAKSLGLKPMAKIRAYASAGIDPAYMGLGVVPAVQKVLKLAGLTLSDIELVELNEAFAAQVLGVARELGLDMEKVNPHGSGISLGHPIGCTGARILVTLVHEMARSNLRLGMATLCIGGGQGMAVVLERE